MLTPGVVQMPSEEDAERCGSPQQRGHGRRWLSRRMAAASLRRMQITCFHIFLDACLIESKARSQKAIAQWRSRDRSDCCWMLRSFVCEANGRVHGQGQGDSESQRQHQFLSCQVNDDASRRRNVERRRPERAWSLGRGLGNVDDCEMERSKIQTEEPGDSNMVHRLCQKIGGLRDRKSSSQRRLDGLIWTLRAERGAE